LDVLEIIIYFLAYTIGVITIFLEIVCYKKKIEYLETILFSIAFLFLIVALSVSIFVGKEKIAEDGFLSNIILYAMVFLGLTTPLNVFAERQISVSKKVFYGIYTSSAITLVLVIAKSFNFFDFNTSLIVSIFLAASIILSMIIIRTTKPEGRIQHKEKSERTLSLIVLLVLPIAFFIEHIAQNVLELSYTTSIMSLTPALIFIMLAISKMKDDLNRLSLFSTENTLEQQNAKNFNLTPRETEIAELLIQGNSYAEISEQLFIAMPTVKTHISNIYKKVEVKNKIGLLNALKS